MKPKLFCLPLSLLILTACAAPAAVSPGDIPTPPPSFSRVSAPPAQSPAAPSPSPSPVAPSASPEITEQEIAGRIAGMAYVTFEELPAVLDDIGRLAAVSDELMLQALAAMETACEHQAEDHIATDAPILKEAYIRTIEVEGVRNYLPDYAALAARFDGLLTPAMRAYLGVILPVRPASDAALAISWRALADYIVHMEQFLDEHAGFEAAHEVALRLKRALGWFWGSEPLPNTPPYGEALREEARDAYGYFLETYPESRYAAATDAVLKLWEGEGWKPTEKVLSALAKLK